jgi:hypothetical protein
MRKKMDSSDEYSPAETARRRDAVLKILINTPQNPPDPWGGAALCQLASSAVTRYHASSAQADLGREDHRDRLLSGVCGGLVGVGAAPRLDPGAVASDGREVVPLCGLERGQHRPCGVIRHRVRSAIVPNHDPLRDPLATGERRSRRFAHLDCSLDSAGGPRDRSHRNVESASGSRWLSVISCATVIPS